MRIKGQIISTILLLMFGLNMLDDLASRHVEDGPDHSLSSFTSFEVSKETKASLSTSTDLSKSKDVAPPECEDPCHLGQCHLGHCAHLVATSYKAALPNPLIALTGLRDLLTPKAPMLEGLKRPPRLS